MPWKHSLPRGFLGLTREKPGTIPDRYISLINDSRWLSALSITGEETAGLESFGQPRLSTGQKEG